MFLAATQPFNTWQEVLEVRIANWGLDIHIGNGALEFRSVGFLEILKSSCSDFERPAIFGNEPQALAERFPATNDRH